MDAFPLQEEQDEALQDWVFHSMDGNEVRRRNLIYLALGNDPELGTDWKYSMCDMRWVDGD